MDRQPLSRQVAIRLLEEIQTGRWRERLPGYRDLGSLLGVSRTTMEAALEHLTQEGVLMPPSGRRGRRIRKDFKHATSRPQHHRVLLVGEAPLPRLWPFTRSVVEESIQRLHRRGYEADYILCPALAHPHPEAVLDELLQVHPDCLWILVKPLHASVQWAISRRIKAVLLGGEVRGHGALPCVAMAIAPLLADATKRLIACGHRDIVLCINDLGEYGRAATIQFARPIFTEAGIPFDSLRNVPEAIANGPEGFNRLLEKIFSDKRPTAIVVRWLGEALALSSFCMKHGIRIPQDLSVLVAELDDLTDWHTPALSGYSLTTHSYVTHIDRWVESNGTALSGGLIQVMPRFVEGATIAAPRKNPGIQQSA
ncbi:substrate-binding domain-containing protein [Luteolibacter ambystomatis]|uniref:Substrate-binding domain-containing protein n=1 Tax=Luteolibacter ambystomatis TaxID=2824561 RepID=A0A975IXY4_9BACT|nr:substrate-binding domain-containing protein [Luteolibacter ambystomatis]QUE49667.1 substrate-binding domain-containing protein [Luteolibacter ambystomatis]